MPSKQPLLNVENLEQHFPIKGASLDVQSTMLKLSTALLFQSIKVKR